MSLPLELISDIVRWATASEDAVDDFSKPDWSRLVGISLASKLFRTLVLESWFQVVRIRESVDWGFIASTHPYIHKKARAIQVVMEVTTEDLGEISNFKNVTALCIVASPLGTGRSVYWEYFSRRLSVQLSQISKLELRNFLTAILPMVKCIASDFPDVQILKLRQPAAFCDQCYLHALPSFAAPIPDQIVYKDARGLPEIYTRFLMPLQNLHTIVLTVGVEEGKFPVNLEDCGHWAGECTSCRQLALSDEVYRNRLLEKKNNAECTLPSLKRVEWNFIKDMDAVWKQMVIDHDLQEERQTLAPLPDDDLEL